MICKECIHYEACEWFGHIYVEEMADDCLRFKPKSRFIELPCKAGDMLYDIYDAVSNGYGGIREFKVPEVHINIDRRNKLWIIISGYYFTFEDFGETVFFTKEEAEKALAEREKK